MGLAGVKKRTKLSHDPNNTAWSKNQTNFGHKILSKQGWKPGDFLGAENANHSEHFTAANASHIKVMLREDNLGLGAHVGKGNAETFGLSMFSGLLGRLNGKDDGELQKQQNAMRDVELRTYTGQKFGFMNFVSGGLLVGDKMEIPKSSEPDKLGAATSSGSKKRKASEDPCEEAGTDSKPAKKKNKVREAEDEHSASSGKKERKLRSSEAVVAAKKANDEAENSASSSNASGSQDDEAKVAKQQKKKKGRKKAEKESESSKTASKQDEKTRRKEEKRARKEERRKRKEEKRAKKAAKEMARSQLSAQTSALPSESEGTATPPVATVYGGRQAVRQRYIQQKRMASMDPQALKEIFMLQAKAAATG